MLKNILLMVGIYSVIADTWRACELIKYKRIMPRNRDTVITVILTIAIYLMIQ